MKIAYLVLCHIDAEHIRRLCQALTYNTDDNIFVHVDGKSDLEMFYERLNDLRNVYLIDKNIDVYHGGFNSVKATIELIRYARNKGNWDRYIILQGLDYPIKDNNYIHNFFIKNTDIEFIRAGNISDIKNKRHSGKISNYKFYDKPNFFKKVINTLGWKLPWATKKRYMIISGEKIDIYFGSALWALTEPCIDYILRYIDTYPEIMKYFKTTGYSDELFFHTIVYNSSFSNKTKYGVESAKLGVVGLRNLHYFEYTVVPKVFTYNDFDLIKDLEELFIKKVNSTESYDLLQKIDKELLLSANNWEAPESFNK